jgi:hypothetical protein
MHSPTVDEKDEKLRLLLLWPLIDKLLVCMEGKLFHLYSTETFIISLELFFKTTTVLPELRILIDPQSFALLEPVPAVWNLCFYFENRSVKHLLWGKASLKLNISKQYHFIFFSREKNDCFSIVKNCLNIQKSIKIISHLQNAAFRLYPKVL